MGETKNTTFMMLYWIILDYIELYWTILDYIGLYWIMKKLNGQY